METGTFLNKDVVEYIDKYCVPLKYVSGRDSEQFMRFNIAIMPSCIVLDSGGNEMGRKKGFLNAVEIVEFLESARSGRDGA